MESGVEPYQLKDLLPLLRENHPLQMLALAAVSYTHLDVYKRQAVKYQITIFFTKLRIIERGATRKKLHIEGADRKVIFSAIN